MKKVMIVVTALIYLVSIIIVAFLGYEAEIHGVDVPADDIVLIYDYSEDPELQGYPYERWENGVIIYTVSENKVPDPSNPDMTKQFNYVIVFKHYDYFYEETDRTILFGPKAISYTGEPVTSPEITYNFNNKKYTTIDTNGNIVFTEYKEQMILVLDIATTGTKTIKKQVMITWDVSSEK